MIRSWRSWSATPSACLLAVLFFWVQAGGSIRDGGLRKEAGQLRSRHPLSDSADAAHSMEQQLRNQRRHLSSSLDPKRQEYTSTMMEQRDYYIFHNVVLMNDSILYYQANDSPLPADLPNRVRLSRYEDQINIPVIIVNSTNRQQLPQCSRRNAQTQPALLFSGTWWDTNIYEFFATTLMPMFQTAVMSGLFDASRIEGLAQEQNVSRHDVIAELHNPVTRAPFTLISGRPTFYGTQWQHLVEAMTTDLVSLQHMQGTCFATLAVSEDGVLRFLYEMVGEMKHEGYRQYRSDWLYRFQRFVMAAERVHLRVLEKPWPVSIGDKGQTLKRPRIVLVSRSTHRRGLLNEPEIVDYMVNNWDVNVTVTKFSDGLAAAIALMQETDVLVGVHGAGLTNSLFMKPGGSLLQLLPYGWELAPGQQLRSSFSQDIPSLLGGQYFQWVNPFPQHAYFNRWSWDAAVRSWDTSYGEVPGAFMEHPDASLKKPFGHSPPDFWVYQNTHVDLSSFGPVLDAAMQSAGAQRLQAAL